MKGSTLLCHTVYILSITIGTIDFLGYRNCQISKILTLLKLLFAKVISYIDI